MVFSLKCKLKGFSLRQKKSLSLVLLIFFFFIWLLILLIDYSDIDSTILRFVLKLLLTFKYRETPIHLTGSKHEIFYTHRDLCHAVPYI